MFNVTAFYFSRLPLVTSEMTCEPHTCRHTVSWGEAAWAHYVHETHSRAAAVNGEECKNDIEIICIIM